MLLPSDLDPGVFTHVSFDNLDPSEATLYGIGSSYDTVTVLFQAESGVKKQPNLTEADGV